MEYKNIEVHIQKAKLVDNNKDMKVKLADKVMDQDPYIEQEKMNKKPKKNCKRPNRLEVPHQD